jgi:hypothetical protein
MKQYDLRTTCFNRELCASVLTWQSLFARALIGPVVGQTPGDDARPRVVSKTPGYESRPVQRVYAETLLWHVQARKVMLPSDTSGSETK